MPSLQESLSLYGETELKPLTTLQKLGGAYLQKNWQTAPHVTHNDEFDFTAVDRLRAKLQAAGTKITPLPIIAKAVVSALQAFPQFNASLDETGQNIILKKYFNLGFAIDTPKGLLVAVVKDADKKSAAQIGAEVVALSEKARARGLPMADMQGGCFTISSLGKIGGTSFTPIINCPEVAILGVSRSYDKPFKAADGGIEWRSVTPMSLSYDHRVINGADAGRFLAHIAASLLSPEALANV